MKRLIRRFWGWYLGRQIRAARPALRSLPGKSIIKQYVDDGIKDYARDLVEFHASIVDHARNSAPFRYPSPMSKLFERALLYVGDQPKAIYIRQTFLLAEESVELASQLEECRERYDALHEISRKALDLSDELLVKVEGIQGNEDLTSSLRMN